MEPEIGQAQFAAGLARSVDICHDEFFKWLDEKITEDWDEKCEDFSEGCPCCEAWKMYAILAVSYKKHD